MGVWQSLSLPLCRGGGSILSCHAGAPGERRSTAAGGSRGPDGHHLRAAQWHPLGDAAAGDTVRVRHGLLMARLSRILVDDDEQPEGPPVMGSLQHEVIGPDMVRPARSQMQARAVREPQPTALGRASGEVFREHVPVGCPRKRTCSHTSHRLLAVLTPPSCGTPGSMNPYGS